MTEPTETTEFEMPIWGGEKGSPAYFRGTFNADDSELAGAWVYPGGGGYQSIMTRIDPAARSLRS